MTEKATNTNRIDFYEEKKWIMAYWFKTRRNINFSENQMLTQWSIWWKGDFGSSSGQMFQDTFTWIKQIVRTMSKAEIKAKRHEVADSSSMPPYIKQLASRKGYCVKKCSTRKHPLRVSGYAIFKNERDKQAKYGKKFNLTAQQVKEILEAKEDK